MAQFREAGEDFSLDRKAAMVAGNGDFHGLWNTSRVRNSGSF
jgi:hypothetical protein